MNEKVLKFPLRNRTKEKLPPPVYDDGWRSKALNARIHQIQNMVDQAPKMSFEDASQVAHNLDTILKREKTKISLGALCGDVNLGDGRDPKALYPYRNSAKEGEICNRQLAKNAKKYIGIVEALAKRLNQDEKPLLKELFGKSSYDDKNMREEGAEPDIVIDLLELIDGMTHWVSQTLPIEEAFKLAEEHKIGYDGLRAYIDTGVWFGDDTGFPRVPVFERRRIVRFDNAPDFVIQNSDGLEFNLFTIDSTSLGIGPDRNNRPVPVLFSDECFCYAQSGHKRYQIWDVTPDREAIEITIRTEDGPEKLNLTGPGLSDLWEEWVGGSEDDLGYDEYHSRIMLFLNQNFNELEAARSQEVRCSWEFQMVGVNANQLGKIKSSDEYADIWGGYLSDISRMTIMYGSGILPQLRNIIVGGHKIHNPCRDLEWVDVYVFKQDLVPRGGWPRGRPPKSDDFAMPELLWVEAHKYTQAVIGAVNQRAGAEKHEQESLLSHFRSTPKKQ